MQVTIFQIKYINDTCSFVDFFSKLDEEEKNVFFQNDARIRTQYAKGT